MEVLGPFKIEELEKLFADAKREGYDSVIIQKQGQNMTVYGRGGEKQPADDKLHYVLRAARERDKWPRAERIEVIGKEL